MVKREPICPKEHEAHREPWLKGYRNGEAVKKALKKYAGVAASPTSKLSGENQ